MDIYQVVNNVGEVVQVGFETKKEAKEVRNQMYSDAGHSKEEMHKILKEGVPPLPFRVVRGKDHWKSNLKQYS
jgi:hypothetical protein